MFKFSQIVGRKTVVTQVIVTVNTSIIRKSFLHNWNLIKFGIGMCNVNIFLHFSVLIHFVKALKQKKIHLRTPTKALYVYIYRDLIRFLKLWVPKKLQKYVVSTNRMYVDARSTVLIPIFDQNCRW